MGSLTPISGSKEHGQVLETSGAAQVEALAVGDAEVDEYVGSLVGEVDGDGKRLVVRNGHPGSGA